MARTSPYHRHLLMLKGVAKTLELAQRDLATVFDETPVPWVSERVAVIMERLSDLETGMEQTITDLEGMKGNPRARRTKRRTGLIRDVRFFREHGGGVVGEATRGALSLARAEREMQRRGWTVEWRDDPDADWSWLDQPGFEKEKAKEHEVYGAVLRDRRGTVLASLWGIFDPDAKYQRVVEAELASEALHGLR